MPFISLQNLIQGYPNISTSTVVLLNWFYSIFNSNSAANRNITNVEPFCYCGAIAGSEFETYAATKLYIAHKLGFDNASLGTGEPHITLFNENNAAMFYPTNNVILYNSGVPAVQYHGQSMFFEDLYFSRLVTVGIANIDFIGLRITLV